MKFEQRQKEFNSAEPDPISSRDQYLNTPIQTMKINVVKQMTVEQITILQRRIATELLTSIKQDTAKTNLNVAIKSLDPSIISSSGTKLIFSNQLPEYDATNEWVKTVHEADCKKILLGKPFRIIFEDHSELLASFRQQAQSCRERNLLVYDCLFDVNRSFFRANPIVITSLDKKDSTQD